MNEELLEELITECNYIVSITPLQEDIGYGVNVDFAGQKNVYYRLVMDEDENIYGIAYSYNEVEEFVPLIMPIIRLYIILDIYRECREMKLPLEVIRITDNEGNKKNIVDLIQLKLNEDESNTEKLMEEFVHALINNKLDHSTFKTKLSEAGLIQTFNIIKGLLLWI